MSTISPMIPERMADTIRTIIIGLAICSKNRRARLFCLASASRLGPKRSRLRAASSRARPFCELPRDWKTSSSFCS